MLDPNVLTWMESTPSAVLTWYSQSGRLEFTGPVMARWLAKTANYVDEVLGGEQPGVALALPASWRTLVWVTGAGLAGGSVYIISEADLSRFDIFVTSNEDEARAAAADDPGLIVLLQDLGMMALEWSGDLPDGVSDAIAEVGSQPDGLAFAGAVPARLPQGEPSPSLEAGNQPVVVCGEPYIGSIWEAWRLQRPAIWIQPGLDTDAIMAQENLV